MQGCQLVDSHKSTGSGPVHSPASCPSKNQKTTTRTKRNQANQKHTQPQPNQNKQKAQRSGIATSNGNNMHDDLLCVIENGHRTRSKTKKTRNHTKGPGKRVMEATKLNAETRDPPSQDPRDHREQPLRHNIHPGTSKQTPTTPGRNESGEKRIKGETGGET